LGPIAELALLREDLRIESRNPLCSWLEDDLPPVELKGLSIIPVDGTHHLFAPLEPSHLKADAENYRVEEGERLSVVHAIEALDRMLQYLIFLRESVELP